MSTEQHSHAGGTRPSHADVAFEPRDIRVNTIVKILVSLGIFVIASFLLLVFVYRGLTHYWTDTYTQPPSLRSQMGPTLPPEPRLQGVPGHLNDAQQDLRDKIRHDTEENYKLEWIDQKSGIAQIPIDDAMQLIVEKGLPAGSPEKK